MNLQVKNSLVENSNLKNENDYIVEKKLIHQLIKDNLVEYRKNFQEHQEFEKNYKQNPWKVGTCGYCFKDRKGKNWMYFGFPKKNMLEIVCKKCLFTNKIWK